MTLERATGLVLRTRPLTETSLIVHWLTRECGRIATVARGARRPKSPFRGQLDLFYLAEISFARSRRSELHTLRESRLLESHAALRVEVEYVRQASYGVALIEQSTEAEAPMPDIFDTFLGLLRQLPIQPPRPEMLFAFEIKLLRELGLEPPLAESSLTAGARQLLQQLLSRDWPEVPRLRPSPAQAAEIRAYLRSFIVFNLGKAPG